MSEDPSFSLAEIRALPNVRVKLEHPDLSLQAHFRNTGRRYQSTLDMAVRNSQHKPFRPSRAVSLVKPSN